MDHTSTIESQNWTWTSNSSGSVISNATATYIRKSIRGRYKYVVHQRNPSLLPYDADVIMKRDSPRLLIIFVSSIQLEKNESDPYKYFFENHTLPKKVEKKISNLIKKQQLIYGSDTSVNAFAWGIMNIRNDNNMFIQSNAKMHGDVDQIHSSCGELFGILGCMRHIDYMLQKYKIKVKHKIPIYSDSQSAIKIAKTQLYLSYREAFSSDADVKTEVRHYYVKLKKYISSYHVRAHQDDKTKFSSLSTTAKLNTLMDRHAKDALLKPRKIKHRRLIPHLPRQKISIKSNYDRITNVLASNINKYKIGHECEKWLGSRWKLVEQQMIDIEWLDIKSVLGNVKGFKRTQFITQTNGNMTGIKWIARSVLFAKQRSKTGLTSYSVKTL